jgi:RAB protein geranylgeranyltransferase component A
MLKDGDMDKYMDFRIVGSILFLHANKLEHVPLSKGTIFESKVLSLFEKRQLLKTLHCLVKIHNLHRKVESDVDEVLYDEFIKTQK